MKLHDTIDVLIGGYLSKDAAEEDYEAVHDSGGHLQGMALDRQGPRGRTCRSRRPTTWSARGRRPWAASGWQSGWSHRRCC